MIFSMLVITEWFQREDSKAAVTMKNSHWILFKKLQVEPQLLQSVVSVQRNKVAVENREQVIDGYLFTYRSKLIIWFSCTSGQIAPPHQNHTWL